MTNDLAKILRYQNLDLKTCRIFPLKYKYIYAIICFFFLVNATRVGLHGGGKIGFKELPKRVISFPKMILFL